MTDPTVSATAGAVRAPSARLEPDAISVAQDTLIGLADTGPTVSVSFTLVMLVAVTAYVAPTVLAITAVPMLIIANAYRRLNLWNAHCGASFEWVGRAVNPYRGFVLPEACAADGEHRELAGIPGEVAVAAIPQLVGQLLERAHQRGIRAATRVIAQALGRIRRPSKNEVVGCFFELGPARQRVIRSAHAASRSIARRMEPKHEPYTSQNGYS